MHKARAGFAIGLGLLLTLTLASPAWAFVIQRDSGTHGDYGTRSGNEGTCGYSAADNTGTAYLRWVKVFPVAAGPSSGLTKQTVHWNVVIQRSTDSGATWQKVAAAATQSGTATNSVSPGFTTVKLGVKGHVGQLFRAVSTIRWYAHGSVVGVIRMRHQDYGVKWTVGSPSFVYTDACDGAAD